MRHRLVVVLELQKLEVYYEMMLAFKMSNNSNVVSLVLVAESRPEMCVEQA